MDLKESFFRKFDWLMFIPAAVLSVIGLTAIYSTDLAEANSDFGNFKKQAITFVLGLLIMAVAMFINYRQLRNGKNILYLAGVLILGGVLIFGKTLNGTTGWFIVGPLTFQPVEVAKIILVIFLADYFSREGRNLFTFRDIFKSFVAAAIFMALVMAQPDFGSSIILFVIWFGMLLASRVRKKHILLMLGVFAVVAVAAWFFVLAPYQKDRIKVFINPNLDPMGAGYNIKQAAIAIGSGGFWGKGIGFGSQSQLRFLPETHTDFIFALIAEEMGFFITAMILGLYLLLFFRVLSASRQATENFTAYLALGFLVIFASEAAINIGMNLGLMPVTGLALPFVSLGGSSLLSKFLMIGILESARLRSP